MELIDTQRQTPMQTQTFSAWLQRRRLIDWITLLVIAGGALYALNTFGAFMDGYEKGILIAAVPVVAVLTWSWPGLRNVLTISAISALASIALYHGDLARAEPRDLAQRWNAYGLRLSQLAQGLDNRAVNPAEVRKTISAENTFFEDLTEIDALEDELWPLCERVAHTARASGVAGRVATLKLKTKDFRLITRRRTLPVPTQTSRTLFNVARELLAAEAPGAAYRLIGAGLSDFVDAADGLDLFAEEERRERRGEAAVDALRERFGKGAVVTGRTLKAKD